jgi:hypothetical protein
MLPKGVHTTLGCRRSDEDYTFVRCPEYKQHFYWNNPKLPTPGPIFSIGTVKIELGGGGRGGVWAITGTLSVFLFIFHQPSVLRQPAWPSRSRYLNPKIQQLQHGRPPQNQFSAVQIIWPVLWRSDWIFFSQLRLCLPSSRFLWYLRFQ